MTLRDCVHTVVLCVGVLSLCASGQAPEPMTVSPNKATMLVGGTQTFRAVGKDGRIRHNVRWKVSPEQAAAITVNGDEVTVEARETSSTVLLTASAEGDSAQASVEIRRAGDMPSGTPIWSVSPTPGCQATKMTQAVPSANGPDLYVQESCGNGMMIRALTADGRELWRRMMGPKEAPPAVPIAQGPYIGFLPNGVTAGAPRNSTEPSGDHIHSHARSVCDGVSSGMTKDEVSKLASEYHLTMERKRWRYDNWEFEEDGSRCTITFDGTTETVVKKKKTIIID